MQQTWCWLKRNWLEAGAGALFVFFAFFFSDKLLYHGDALRQNFPFRFYSASRLRSGELPFWTEKIFSGFPLLAEGQAGVFYPWNIFYLFWPYPKTFMLLLAFHISLGFFGMAFLLRKLELSRLAAAIGGTAFSLCGPSVARWNQTNFFEALMWIPFVLLPFVGVHRKSEPIVASIAIAQIWLTSHAQVAFLAGMLSLGFWLIQKEKRGNSGIWLFGLALASVQLLPLSELLGETVRGSMPLEQAAFFSPTLAELLRGMVKTEDFPGSFFLIDRATEMTFYLGIPLLFLSAAGFFSLPGRVRAALCLIATMGILLTPGEHSPFFQFLYRHQLGIHLFRVPSRYFWLIALPCIFSAAKGVDRLAKKSSLLPGLLSLLLLLDLGSLSLTFYPLLPIQKFQKAFFELKQSPLAETESRFHLVSAELLREALRSSAFLREPLFFLYWMLPNTNLLFGAASVDGYSPLHLKSYKRLFSPVPSRKTLDVLSTRWVLARFLEGEGLSEKSWESFGARLYLNTRAKPRLRLAETVRFLTREKLKEVIRHGFFQNEVLFSQLPQSACSQKDTVQGKVEWIKDSYQVKKFRANLSSDGYVVVATAYYPGWTAYVDGHRVPLARAYNFLLAICVPAGNHEVSMFFRPISFTFGLTLSLLALLLAATRIKSSFLRKTILRS